MSIRCRYVWKVNNKKGSCKSLILFFPILESGDYLFDLRKSQFKKMMKLRFHLVSMQDISKNCISISILFSQDALLPFQFYYLHIIFSGLVDDFFKDENIEGARCDMCHGHEKYIGVLSSFQTL